MSELKTTARRYNKDKNRLELLPDKPLELIADVYTKGAHKHSIYEDEEGNQISGKDIPFEERGNYKIIEDGADNWRKGLSWKDTTGSLLRHILAYRKGEDYDHELMTYHLANAGWNILTLLDYYDSHPEMDDRNHSYLKYPKIGLDIDEVIADFTAGWAAVHGVDERPECWNYHRNMGAEFAKMKEAGTLDDFYLSLKPKISPNDIPFEPHCYVTSRPVDTAITEKWLEIHKFPGSKVITVPLGTSKVQVLKDAGVEIFIDDAFHNFVELNKAGVCCFLLDAPHNRRYNVGFKRIYSLKDFLNREIKWK